jgi:hypothetical protein
MANAKRTALLPLIALVAAFAPIACESKRNDEANGASPSDEDLYARAITYRTVAVGALAALKPGTTREECLSRLHTLGRHECTCVDGNGDVITIHSVFL